MRLNLASLIAATGLMFAAGTAHAGVVYSNNFSGNTAGFTGSGFITTAPSGEQFLSFGGAGGSGTLTLSGVASHSTVTLSFDLYAVGSVDGNGTYLPGGGNGDYFNVSYSGSSSSTLLNQAFSNYGGGETQSYPAPGSAPGTGAYATNALGYTGFPAAAGIQDTQYAFTLVANDISPTLSFTFQDNSNEGTGNEFYGIDNVVVSSNGSAPVGVPEPATLSLIGAGLIGLGAIRRRVLG